MTRYLPTPEERAALEAKGWNCEPDGWWWPRGEPVPGYTYREAVREQERRERERRRKGQQR